MKLNQTERATVFAALKALETMAKSATGDCEIAPGSSIDVSGKTVTITIPDGWTVERDKGDDGIIEKTATQNAYGLAVLALMLERLERFNQNNVVLDAITGAIEQALLRNVPTAEVMRKEHPKFQQLEDSIKAVQQRIPKRKEPTARKLTKTKAKPTITIGDKVRNAA